jgi:mannose-6-phosphate isomerase-like protein (cupin superfamily)
MRRHLALVIGIASLLLSVSAAQTNNAATTAPQGGTTLGDHNTPLRPLTGAGNVGISNAVLRDQADIRTIRVVVEPGGKRAMHAHNDVKFHLFVPISGAMVVDLDGGKTVDVPAWQPYYMKAGTQHGFHNTGSSAVEIMEIFVK